MSTLCVLVLGLICSCVCVLVFTLGSVFPDLVLFCLIDLMFRFICLDLTGVFRFVWCLVGCCVLIGWVLALDWIGCLVFCMFSMGWTFCWFVVGCLIVSFVLDCAL